MSRQRSARRPPAGGRSGGCRPGAWKGRHAAPPRSSGRLGRRRPPSAAVIGLAADGHHHLHRLGQGVRDQIAPACAPCCRPGPGRQVVALDPDVWPAQPGRQSREWVKRRGKVAERETGYSSGRMIYLRPQSVRIIALNPGAASRTHRRSGHTCPPCAGASNGTRGSTRTALYRRANPCRANGQAATGPASSSGAANSFGWHSRPVMSMVTRLKAGTSAASMIA